MNQETSQNPELKDLNPKETARIDQIKEYEALKKVKDVIEALVKMALDPNAGKRSKAIAIACLLYVISPLDAIPDVLPVVGWSDDIAVIVATVSQIAVKLKPYMSTVALGALLIPENNTPERENEITVLIPNDKETSNTTLIEQLKRFQLIMTATLILVAIVVMSSLVFNAILMFKLTHH